ncbi:lipid-A-disaccharide synthase [Alkalimonas mucilaginosa]|uniref:Lipid-A-disaccharide synthase n=1 Tax=Alkalimonas mucilaginosa TaxID=3057676 RepID=A0ABU7JGM7_9GAMM|nr:lipid-A-disaccharide synthase [Alkalimonas sp. MEB004]MEE2024591.1 lipid-A-disaccharide synthase [Alkalimonas sp. MEB004]
MPSKTLSAAAPRIAIIVGEHSGDILAAGVMEAVLRLHPDASFYGIGGPRMQALGFDAWFDMEELAVMGLVEVLGRLPRLLRIRKELIQRLLAEQPDLVLGVDAPDFNLPVEHKLKQAGLTTVHYVSPSVWAWRQKRIHKIAAATDLVLALLPFEKAFYDKHQVPCRFVGHTLADQMPITPDKAAAKVSMGWHSQTVLALMPGSRSNEIKLLSPAFLQAAARLKAIQPELQLVCAMVTEQKAAIFQAIKQQVAPDLELRLVIGQSRQVLMAADAVFIASGTATLEAMLAKCPMVVAYKLNAITFQLAKWLVKIDYFSLPNLLANEALVPELLQHEVNPDALVAAMQPLFGQDANSLIQRFTELHQQLACDASQQAAEAILTLIATSSSSHD